MKKLKKIIIYGFVGIISICLISVLCFVISNKLFLESENKENISYLKNNNTVVHDRITDELFDEDFYQSDVFLLGEIHGYADNQKLDKELFFYLNKKLGIKYYLAEMDSLTAKDLNTFLADSIKKPTLLKKIVLEIGKRIPQQSSKELFDKWEEIYAYNKQLPDSLKITVLGIDKNFSDNSSTLRDEAMLTNFKNYVKAMHLENEKFYGLFGFFHTLQTPIKGADILFASELKNAGFKTTSFVSYTLDSEVYLPKNPQFPTPENEKADWINADGPLQLVKGINDLAAVSKPNSITLYKLNRDRSPYFKTQRLANIKSRFFGENITPTENSFTTDYFQYVFLLRNSKPLTRLK